MRSCVMLGRVLSRDVGLGEVMEISDKFVDAFCAARGCCPKEPINRIMARVNMGYVLKAMDECGLVMSRSVVEDVEINDEEKVA